MIKKGVKRQRINKTADKDNIKSQIAKLKQNLSSLQYNRLRFSTGKRSSYRSIAEINKTGKNISDQIEKLNIELKSTTNGAAKLAAKTQRIFNRREGGIVLENNKSKKDQGFIPWKPVKIEAGMVNEIIDEISSEGHMATYIASWVKGRPAVRILRKTENGTRPHAYYGARTNMATAPENLYNSRNEAFGNAFSNINSNKHGNILHHSQLTGIGVSKLVSMLSTANGNQYIYLDTKLIMDRYTADQAKWVNINKDHYVVKPFSYNFASQLSMWKQTKNEDLIEQMNNELKNSVPYYFNKAGVYSGDKPLCMYCVYNNIPFLWERSVQGKYTYYMSNVNSKRNLKSELSKSADKNIVTNKIVYHFDDKKVILNIMKIVDTFHDFIGTRSALTPTQVTAYMSQIYGTQEPYKEIINFLGENKTNIRNTENIFGEILREPAISGSVEAINGNDKFMELLNKQKLNDYCWIYDAGTKIPIPLLQKLASTTQRATNSFYGPLGRLSAESYRMNLTNYFTKGRTNFIPTG